jgi:hypothetical protein
MLLPLCLSIALAVAAPLRAELQEAASATLAQSDAAVDLLDGAGFACVDSRRGQRARMRATAPASRACAPPPRAHARAHRAAPPAARRLQRRQGAAEQVRLRLASWLHRLPVDGQRDV